MRDIEKGLKKDRYLGCQYTDTRVFDFSRSRRTSFHCFFSRCFSTRRTFLCITIFYGTLKFYLGCGAASTVLLPMYKTLVFHCDKEILCNHLLLNKFYVFFFFFNNKLHFINRKRKRIWYAKVYITHVNKTIIVVVVHSVLAKKINK